MYDVAIIGSGPAGLEAALTLKNRDKSFIIFGSNKLSEKVYKAHEVRNYLGLPNIKGEDFMNAFLNHIKVMDINITDDHIKQIYDLGTHFALQGEKSTDFYEAKAIIIATGVSVNKPFVGENEFLGRGVSYCATCDAPLYKNKRIGVIIDSEDEYAEVEFLSTVASHIDLFPLYDFNKALDSKIEIHNEKIISLNGTKFLESIKTENNEFKVDGVFVLRKSVPMTYLISGIEMDNNHIKVDRNMKTNLKGVFAAGDITGAPYQYIKAAGEGNVAAHSVVNYLREEK
ncbi:MAG: NAD(P)/FAD-dependent oxidoreductase [Acholeplasmatales bacterium]|nr:NAD(P)/FAD-dependent oxidoreductase [Acholeplasmatales bacterium]